MSNRGHPANLELRALHADGGELWRQLRLRALADAPDAFADTAAEWHPRGDAERRWRSRLDDVPFNVVAVRDGAPVGQVSATVLDEHGRSELTSMWVDPAARGCGVGEALVAAVVDWARRTGGSAVVLSVQRSNAPAVRLYARCGFTPIDESAPGSCDLRMGRPCA